MLSYGVCTVNFVSKTVLFRINLEFLSWATFDVVFYTV